MGRSSFQFSPGHIFGWVGGKKNEMNMTIAVESQFKQLGSRPKKRFFGASTGFEPKH